MNYESFVATYGNLLKKEDLSGDASFLIDPCPVLLYDRFQGSTVPVTLFGLGTGVFVSENDNGRLFVRLQPGNADCCRVSFCDVTLSPHAAADVRLWFRFASPEAAGDWFKYFSQLVTPDALPSPLLSISKYSESRYESASMEGDIFRQLWLPSTPGADTLVLICHGFGAAGPVHFDADDYYCQLVQLFLSQGIAVAALDHWGHARSDGVPFGMVADFSLIIKDALECLRLSKVDVERVVGHSPKKTVVYGESMGGAIALNLVLAQPEWFDGCCLLAPMTAIDERVKPPALVQSVLLRVSSVWPSLAILKNDVLPNVFHDPKIAEKVYRSPITYSERLHLGSASVVLDVMDKLEKNVSQINLPVLILHGAADKVIPPEASKRLSATIPSAELKTYPGLHHGVWKHSSVDLQSVKADITNWFRKLNIS